MLDEIADMTMEDEMDLASLGEKKRAIFVCTPVNDTSFNYLVSMMYMQAFQQLYDRAEREYGGRLPRHVRFIMDEFYNTPPPDRFDNVLSTCRSYNPVLVQLSCRTSDRSKLCLKKSGIADSTVRSVPLPRRQ